MLVRRIRLLGDNSFQPQFRRSAVHGIAVLGDVFRILDQAGRGQRPLEILFAFGQWQPAEIVFAQGEQVERVQRRRIFAHGAGDRAGFFQSAALLQTGETGHAGGVVTDGFTVDDEVRKGQPPYRFDDFRKGR